MKSVSVPFCGEKTRLKTKAHGGGSGWLCGNGLICLIGATEQLPGSVWVYLLIWSKRITAPKFRARNNILQ